MLLVDSDQNYHLRKKKRRNYGLYLCYQKQSPILLVIEDYLKNLQTPTALLRIKHKKFNEVRELYLTKIKLLIILAKLAIFVDTITIQVINCYLCIFNN